MSFHTDSDEDDDEPIDCALVDCKPLTCKRQKTPPGECCPVCAWQWRREKNRKNKQKKTNKKPTQFKSK